MSEAPQVLLHHHLKALKLPTFLREYEKVARQCASEGVDQVRYLTRLVELELIDRERRLVERRVRAAHFPTVKSLDSYDFAALPSLNKLLVLELARCEYVERRENVIAVADRAFEAGERLAMGGHHHSIEGVSSRIVPASAFDNDSPAPFYLASNATLRQAVAAGEPIRMSDLDLSAESELLQLRRRQDEIFQSRRSY